MCGGGIWEYATHRSEHVSFTGQVRVFELRSTRLCTRRPQYRIDGVPPRVVKKHILGTDQKYTLYLNQKGVV